MHVAGIAFRMCILQRHIPSMLLYQSIIKIKIIYTDSTIRHSSYGFWFKLLGEISMHVFYRSELICDTKMIPFSTTNLLVSCLTVCSWACLLEGDTLHLKSVSSAENIMFRCREGFFFFESEWWVSQGDLGVACKYSRTVTNGKGLNRLGFTHPEGISNWAHL